MRRRAARWLSVVVALVLLGAAASPAARGAGRILARSSFDPAADGYDFANYGAAAGLPNLGTDELELLFGNSVCAGFDGGVCVLSPPALAWMNEQNALMADGHCVGLSITALLFWARLSSPLTFGSNTVPRLELTGNQLLARDIAYAYVFQSLASVQAQEVSASPDAVLHTLISSLDADTPLYTLGFSQPDGSDGHAVTPFAVQRLGGSRDAILAYDNNDPRTTRELIVNTASDSWSYRGAADPGQPATQYSGSASTHTLLLLPARPGLGVQPCPFCSSTSTAVGAAQGVITGTVGAAGATGVLGAATRARVTRALETVRLQAGGGEARMLVVGPHGRETGYLRGRIVNRIPGARIINLLVDSSRGTGDPGSEYELPTGAAYRIELTGVRSARGERGSLTVIEPGFVASADRLALGRGAGAELMLSADGHAIAFQATRGRQAPELIVGNAQPGANDYQWDITDTHASSRARVSAALDVTRRRLRLSGAGRYDMTMDLVRNRVSVFRHAAVPVGTATAQFAYGNWSSGQAMPATGLASGTAPTGELDNEPSSSDTGAEFTPVESTPAAPEPQPTPAAAGSTQTTVSCSPSEFDSSQTSECDVQVASLDSATPGTPTGTVAFTSDDGGSFSPADCTLTDGACAVTYTPDSTSSSPELTAAYGGDDTFDASSDSVTLTVTPVAGTAIACDPAAVPVDAPTTCTVTVTSSDPDAQAPTGEVDFSTDSDGSFSATSCTLADGSCAVSYTPTAVDSGSHQITAAYAGDGVDPPSQASAAVTVSLRATNTSLACDPDSVPDGSSTTCTATVTDIDTGTPQTPTGTVTFAASTTGAFTGNPCELSGSGATATCSVSFTPDGDSADTSEISASYGGDGTHAPS